MASKGVGTGRRTPLQAETLTYVEHLENRLMTAPPKQKGMRTRERLKISAAKLLQNGGYHALKVSDISSGASVAEGSFYMYFRDKVDVTQTVLYEFLLEFVPNMMKPIGARTPFEAICETNRRWIALARANAGVFRCLLQFSDEDPSFGKVVQNSNRQWYERVLNSLPRSKPEADRSTLLLVIYLLGAMMDDLLRKLVIYPDEELRFLLAQLEITDEVVADAASLIWMRVLYGTMPSTDTNAAVIQAIAALMDPAASRRHSDSNSNRAE